jgi:hypothetical protein
MLLMSFQRQLLVDVEFHFPLMLFGRVKMRQHQLERKTMMMASLLKNYQIHGIIIKEA